MHAFCLYGSFHPSSVLDFMFNPWDLCYHSFSALTLLVGQHEGHLPCKNFCFKTLQDEDKYK